MKTNLKYLWFIGIAATAFIFGNCRDMHPDQIPHPEAAKLDCTKVNNPAESGYELNKDEIPAAIDKTETKETKDTILAPSVTSGNKVNIKTISK